MPNIGLVEVSTGGFDVETRLVVGGEVNSRQSPFRITGDGNNITDERLDSLIAHMEAIADTASNALDPAITAKALHFAGGSFESESFYEIPTWGACSSIFGDGPSTFLDNFGIHVQHNNCSVRNLLLGKRDNVYVDGSYGLKFSENIREGVFDAVSVRRKDFGLIGVHSYATLSIAREFVAWINLKGFQARQCRTGILTNGAVGFALNNFVINGSTEMGGNLFQCGGMKMQDGFINGAGHALWFRGSYRAKCQENYVTHVTGTGFSRRNVPILSLTDSGGFARLVLAEKVAATVRNRSGRMIPLRDTTEDHVDTTFGIIVASGTEAGSIDSVQVDGQELLSAPVPFTTDFNTTMRTVAANIDAGTGLHEYNCDGSGGSRIYINGPIEAVGFTVTASSSGGITVAPQNYVAIEFTGGLPSTAVEGAEVKFTALSGSTFYDGQHPIRYVEDANTIVTEIPYDSDADGEAWKPYIGLFSGQSDVDIIGDQATSNVSITACDDVSITLETAYSDLDPIGASSIDVGEFDILIEALDTSASRVSDIFFLGGNFNYCRIKNARNISFVGTRVKQVIWIDDWANESFRCQRILHVRLGFGRTVNNDDEIFDNVPISGSNVGWTIVEAGQTGDADIGTDCCRLVTPNANLPLVNNVAQTNVVEVGAEVINLMIGASGCIVNEDGGLWVGGEPDDPAYFAISGTYTADDRLAKIEATLASTATGNQYGWDHSPSFEPAGASLTTVRAFQSMATIASTNFSITNAHASLAAINLGSGFSGTVAAGRGYNAPNPTVSGGSFTNYYQFHAEALSTNNGNTSGSKTHRQFYGTGITAGTSGGTNNNYTAEFVVPSGGSSSGTTQNQGLRITGNGGTAAGGTVNNFAIRSTSTAASQLDGNLQAAKFVYGTTRAGNATLVGGTVTVANTTVTANTIVQITHKTDGGTPGARYTYTVSAGVSFTITSDNAADTSVLSWSLIETA